MLKSEQNKTDSPVTIADKIAFGFAFTLGLIGGGAVLNEAFQGIYEAPFWLGVVVLSGLPPLAILLGLPFQEYFPWMDWVKILSASVLGGLLARLMIPAGVVGFLVCVVMWSLFSDAKSIRSSSL